MRRVLLSSAVACLLLSACSGGGDTAASGGAAGNRSGGRLEDFLGVLLDRDLHAISALLLGETVTGETLAFGLAEESGRWPKARPRNRPPMS